MAGRLVMALIIAALAVMLAAPPAAALEVAGVKLEQKITLGTDGKELICNGAGIRKKFVIKVYVGALYLPETASDPARAAAIPGPKRVLLHFL
jgi:long-chain acyl-CoA synthetase